MEYLQIIVLGIVQGITEFLPISSDGHLVVANEIVCALSSQSIPKGDLLVTLILHQGTLLSILMVYRREIWQLLGANRRVIGLLIVGTIPAGIIGIILKEFFEAEMTDPVLTGFMLPLNGLMLLWMSRRKPGEGRYEDLTWKQALLIGLAESLAPLPGISRSGTTIAAGLALGLSRQAAATFSFLLAIPVLVGAGVLALNDLRKGEPISATAGPLLVGAIVAFLVGLASLLLLLKWLRQGKLAPMGWWCIALGIFLLFWQFTR